MKISQLTPEKDYNWYFHMPQLSLLRGDSQMAFDLGQIGLFLVSKKGENNQEQKQKQKIYEEESQK